MNPIDLSAPPFPSGQEEMVGGRWLQWNQEVVSRSEDRPELPPPHPYLWLRELPSRGILVMLPQRGHSHCQNDRRQIAKCVLA